MYQVSACSCHEYFVRRTTRTGTLTRRQSVQARFRPQSPSERRPTSEADIQKDPLSAVWGIFDLSAHQVRSRQTRKRKGEPFLFKNTAILWRVSVNMLSQPNNEQQTEPARITIEHNSQVPNELQPRGFHSWKTFRIASSVMEKFCGTINPDSERLNRTREEYGHRYELRALLRLHSAVGFESIQERDRTARESSTLDLQLP